MRLRLNPLSQNGISVVNDNTTIVNTGSSSTSTGATSLADLTDVDATVATPSDGDIIVYRDAGSDWVLEAKPAGGSNPALNDVTDVTISAVADNEVLAYDSGTTTWINQTASEAGLATSAQGALADSAVQPGDNISTLTNDSGYVTSSGYAPGGTDVALADGGTGSSLTDPNADRILFWDDSGSVVTWLTPSTGLTISGTNMTVRASSTTQTGIIETATSAEALTGTDTSRAVTPAGVKAVADTKANLSHTHTASEVTDFDTEVSNNTDVAANTAARHDAVTVLDSSEIDFTLTGQQITASLVAGSIDETKLDTSVNASLDLADSATQPGDNISTLTNDSGFITGSSPTITTPTLTLKQGLTPTPTAEGEIQWDTDNNQIKVGDGVGTKTFSDDSVNAATYQPLDSDLTTIAAANNGTVLANTTASFTTADETKLDGIETGADVTDTANVTAAGALMDSEVDADIKTLSLPANTTISTFGASLVDDIDAATARTTLGVDAAGTDNSTDVTLAGTPDYITIAGQVITRNAIDLTTDVTGTLPIANGGTGASTAAGAATNLAVEVGKILFPVGAIYVSGVATNPATLLGFGTWTQIEGKFLVGVSTTDTDFDLDDTGGAKTHTLTESEIPGHTHSGSSLSTSNPGNHTHTIGAYTSVNEAGGFGLTGSASFTNRPLVSTASGQSTGGSGSHTHTISGNTGSTGGGGAHENLPPFIAKYIWQRTA